MSQKMYNAMVIWAFVLMTIITCAFAYTIIDTANQIDAYHQKYDEYEN